MRRLRRQRVQIPLFVASAALFVLGAVLIFVSTLAHAPFQLRWGYPPVFAGPMVMAVAAMPGDVRLLRALLVGVGAVVVAVCAVQAGGAIVLAQRVADDAQNGRTIAVHYTAAIGTCVAVLVVGPWLALTSLWLLAGSCTGVVSPLRLPTLVLRLLSVTYVLLGSSYGLILSSIPPFDATGDVNLPDGRAARVELFGIYVWICMQCLSMGLVGLLKRDLRARVHGFLANRGVGVDAAAGIAELLNGVKAADVLRQAKLSFRAISLDDLTYEHLAVQHVPKQRAKRRSLIGAAFIRAARIAPDVDAPDELVSASSSDGVERACSYSADSNVRVARASHEHARASTLPTQRAAPAVEIAGAARLGHVDAFVSHSWHDPPAAKWRALQVWGAEFRAAHGRAPLLWFDRCCIDQADIDAQLPSLPVYLAGCNTLLVLHGPTYLSRLWCIVELFIFFQAHLPAPPSERIRFLTIDAPWPTNAAASAEARRETRASWGPSEPPPSEGGTRGDATGEWRAEDATRAQLAALAEAEAFDVRRARATVVSDEERLLAVIEGSGEAVEHFSRWIRELVVAKLREKLARDGREAAHAGKGGGSTSRGDTLRAARMSRGASSSS